jgi:hypothetical protein
MRRSFLRVLLVLASTASIGLLTIGTTAANAATSRPPSHPLTASSLKLRAAPDSVETVAVSPRLELPGCDRDDGYNGNVQWGSLPNPQFVKTWGELWDVCGTTAYLYMSWYSPGYNNPQVASAPDYTTVGVNSSYSTTPFNPGYISVTVCAWWFDQWKCGTSDEV